MLSTASLPSSNNTSNGLDHQSQIPAISNRFTKIEAASNSAQKFNDTTASGGEETGNAVTSMDLDKEIIQTNDSTGSHKFMDLQEDSAKILESVKSDQWNLMKVRVGFDVTRKGERSLVIDGYKFTKSRDGMSDRVFWRCSRRECKATAVTVAGRVEHVRTLHTHKPPTAGEFFVEHRGAEGETQRQGQLQTVRFNYTSAAAHAGSKSRMRRRSHQPKEKSSILPSIIAPVSSQTTGPEKKARFYSGDSKLHAKAVAAILSNIVERSVASEDKNRQSFQPNNGLQKPANCENAANSQKFNLQISHSGGNVGYFHAASEKDGPQLHHRSVGIGGFGVRFSALSQFGQVNTTVASQDVLDRRDSQNSTPDPPFEVPVSSPPLPSTQHIYTSAPTLEPISPPLDPYSNSSSQLQTSVNERFQKHHSVAATTSFNLVRKNDLGQIVLLVGDQLAGLQRPPQMPAGFALDLVSSINDTRDGMVGSSVQRLSNGGKLVNSSLAQPYNDSGCAQHISHHVSSSSHRTRLVEPCGCRVSQNDQLQTSSTNCLATTTTESQFVGSIVNNGSTMLHWKKEKMRESEASEQQINISNTNGMSLSHEDVEEEGLWHQQKRRRHFTGFSHFESPSAADTPSATALNTTFSSGSRRKRCASACQSSCNGPLSSSLFPTGFHSSLPVACANYPGLEEVSEGVEGGHRPSNHTQQQHEAVSAWCTQVQDDLLVKVLNTVQQLTVKLDADADPPELVIQNCKAIQACLDTLRALKRIRACSSPQSDTSGFHLKPPIDSPNS